MNLYKDEFGNVHAEKVVGSTCWVEDRALTELEGEHEVTCVECQKSLAKFESMTDLQKCKAWVKKASQEFKDSFKANFYAFDVNVTYYRYEGEQVEFCERFRVSELTGKFLKYAVEEAREQGFDEVCFALIPETRESFHDEWEDCEGECSSFELDV